jgi:hypothetical protein
MKKLLFACWHSEARERPGWTVIIETLKEELILHPPGPQQPKRRVETQGKMEGEEEVAGATTSKSSNLVATSWEEVAAQGLGTEAFATWKVKTILEILPQLLPIVKVILQRWNILAQHTNFNISDNTVDPYSTFGNLGIEPVRNAFGKVVCAFANAWLLKIETTDDDVSPRKVRVESSSHNIADPRKWIMRFWADNAYNLLGPTAKCWLKEILTTSKEWQAFRTTFHVWQSENERILQRCVNARQRAAAREKAVLRKPIVWDPVMVKNSKFMEDLKLQVQFVYNN